jgi:hypothetical protein
MYSRGVVCRGLRSDSKAALVDVTQAQKSRRRVQIADNVVVVNSIGHVDHYSIYCDACGITHIVGIYGKCSDCNGKSVRKWDEGDVRALDGVLNQLPTVCCSMNFVVAVLKPFGIAKPYITQTTNCVSHCCSIHKMICDLIFACFACGPEPWLIFLLDLEYTLLLKKFPFPLQFLDHCNTTINNFHP